MMIVKVEFFIPAENAPTVRDALGQAGFGRIGRYDHCATETKVTGDWRSLDGADPHLGKVGEIFSGEELKVEFVCRTERASEAVKIIRSLHPYEEPLILVLPLMNQDVEGSTQDIG